MSKDKKTEEKSDEAVRIVALSAVVDVTREDLEKAPSDRALTLVEKSKNLVFHGSVKDMSPVEKVRAFVLVTRLANALDRRKKVLRKEVDEMLAENAPTLSDREVRLEAGEGFAAVSKNGSYGKKVLNRDRAIALLKKKEEETGKPLVGTCMVIPEPPPPYFSQEKFEALVTLGILKADDVSECMDDVPVSTTVTVDCDEIYDVAIAGAILGPDLAVKKALKKGKKESL